MINLNILSFSEIVGQDKAKKSLILNIINPKIGGVLISGKRGQGKTSLVRSAKSILNDIKIVNVPLNITEDRLIGGIDLENIIGNGNKKIEYGLLKHAHKNILYIDEINIISESIINIILNTMSTGINQIEREGVSHNHDCEFILIGTMNPEEGYLKKSILDKFGHYVEMESLCVEGRTEVISGNLNLGVSKEDIVQSYREENETIKQKITEAKDILNQVVVTEKDYYIIADICEKARSEGHRGEIVILETAQAIAALEGRKALELKDIEEAAVFSLPHRLKEDLEIEIEEAEDFNNTSEQSEKNREEQIKDNSLNNKIPQTDETYMDEILEEIEKIGQGLKIQVKEKKNQGLGSGKRSKTKSGSKDGRYIKYRIKEPTEDIAIYPSIKIAAINQIKRESTDLALNIKKSDLREKIREKNTGANIMFLVDASSSMGARRRMGAVKGAVLSLLTDAYEKRDNVGIVAFRNKNAEVLLNFTRSVDLAEKSLKDIKTGGETPLALGLEKTLNLFIGDKTKNPESLQYLVLVSDCKGNVPLHGNSPMEAAYNIGTKINRFGIKTMILDTDQNFMSIDYGDKLAEAMDAEHIRLWRINKEEIKSKTMDLIYNSVMNIY